MGGANNIRPLTHDGRTMSVSEWARHLGIRQNTIILRLRRGWSVDDALARPVERSRRWGEKRTMQQQRGETA